MDLQRTVTPEVKAHEIVALGTSVKTSKNSVVISGIITCKDRCKDKARDTNECLKMLSSSRNIPSVDHCRCYRAHINYGGSYLNYMGSN